MWPPERKGSPHRGSPTKTKMTDCYAAALAKRFNAPVVTADPEFEEVRKEIRIIGV